MDAPSSFCIRSVSWLLHCLSASVPLLAVVTSVATPPHPRPSAIPKPNPKSFPSLGLPFPTLPHFVLPSACSSPSPFSFLCHLPSTQTRHACEAFLWPHQFVPSRTRTTAPELETQENRKRRPLATPLPSPLLDFGTYLPKVP